VQIAGSSTTVRSSWTEPAEPARQGGQLRQLPALSGGLDYREQHLAVHRPKDRPRGTFSVAAWHATCKPMTLFTPLKSLKRNGQPELCGRPGQTGLDEHEKD
jgi:hypothetical protein